LGDGDALGVEDAMVGRTIGRTKEGSQRAVQEIAMKYESESQQGYRRMIAIFGTDIKRNDAREALVGQLEEARERTRFLLEPLSEEDLAIQHDPIMSPLIWDYGHIANY